MFLLGIIAISCVPGIAYATLAGTNVDEVRGYPLRSFQLARPYSSAMSSWHIYDDCIFTTNRVSLTRDQPSQSGAFWSKERITSRSWEMQLRLRMTASGPPGDGIAIWYASHPQKGPIFGGPDSFEGITVVLDTYKNRYSGSEAYPMVYALFNNGQSTMNPEDDGFSSRMDGKDAGCHFPSAVSRIEDNKVVKLLLRYSDDVLDVYFAGYDEMEWKHCHSYKGLVLPTNYHIGVSANTGDLSSAHDVISLKMFELESSGKQTDHRQLAYTGDKEYYTVTESSEKHTGSFWSAFVYSFYTAVIAVILFLGYLIYTNFFASKKSTKRFY